MVIASIDSSPSSYQPTIYASDVGGDTDVLIGNNNILGNFGNMVKGGVARAGQDVGVNGDIASSVDDVSDTLLKGGCAGDNKVASN